MSNCLVVSHFSWLAASSWLVRAVDSIDCAFTFAEHLRGGREHPGIMMAQLANVLHKNRFYYFFLGNGSTYEKRIC